MPYPDRAAPRRGHAASPRSSPAARPVAQSQCGSRNSERRNPGPKALPMLRDNRTDVRTAAARAVPRRSPARPDPRRSQPRIRACSESGRCPRYEAITGRQTDAPNRNSTAPNKRGRDAGSRWGSGQNGKRVASSIASRHARSIAVRRTASLPLA